MGFKDPAKLHTLASAVYAFGVWTMIGSLVILKYTGRLENTPEKKEGEEESYSTMISNLFKSFSSEPGDSDK